MSKERFNQVIDEVYRNYLETHKYEPFIMTEEMDLTQDEFIEKATNNYGFGFLFGIRINERELSLEERFNLRYPGGNFSVFQENYPNTHKRNNPNDLLDVFNIPTKLITLTYNNEAIEVYE